ncbi:MAG TPA: serine/threonine-protein kinase [Polyangiaceae bacterium]|nr:serine/threonine-protein kinase [Polyangiaceae bacterium]
MMTRPLAHGEPRRGQVLGGAELLSPVARGGMAVVWAARRAGTHESMPSLAVKVLLPGLATDVHFQKMLRAEARIAERIEHPNVCRVFGSGEARGIFYITMEFLAGETLAALLQREQRIPCELAVQIAYNAARGLGAAHELVGADGRPLGVVHRDVSPQNIMLTTRGEVKVVDFGVAKCFATDGSLTRSGYLKGKVAYMSPEQVYCEAVDARTDVFALGVVLYQASTGRHPFAAGAQLGTLVNIAGPDPAPCPRTFVPGYPATLAAVLARALAKDPEQRIQSMREFVNELERVGAELGATSGAVHRYLEAKSGAGAKAHAAPASRRPRGARRVDPSPRGLLAGFEAARRSPLHTAAIGAAALLGALALEVRPVPGQRLPVPQRARTAVTSPEVRLNAHRAKSLLAAMPQKSLFQATAADELNGGQAAATTIRKGKSAQTLSESETESFLLRSRE